MLHFSFAMGSNHIKILWGGVCVNFETNKNNEENR